MRPLQRLRCDIPTLSLSSRSFQRGLATCQRPTTTLHSARAQIKPVSSRPVLQQSFRRSYADIVTPKPKRRGRSVLRWTWRLTYLSAIGGLVYMGYGIYLLRTPQEQLEPDPTKKNLVILGETIRVQISDFAIDLPQVRVGELYLSSRNSTPRITMSSSSPPAISSSSPHYYRHVRLALSSTGPLWSPYGTFFDIRKPR